MKSKDAIRQYQKQKQLEKPDGKTLLLCYERLMEAAARHESTAVERAIDLLQDSLKPAANPKLALHLVQLYEYMRHCLKNGQFSEICRVAESLRNTWEAAMEADEGNANT